MTFERALRFVLRWEGGYSDHPADPGGATNMGITQATYDAWRRRQGLPPQPVRNISINEVQAIYRTMYWDPIGADSLPDPLALAAFDLAVNSGVDTARRALREAGQDWRRLIAWRISMLTNLHHFPTFGRGWMRRVAALISECAALDPIQPRLEEVRRVVVDGGAPRPVEKVSIVRDKLYVRTREEEGT